MLYLPFNPIRKSRSRTAADTSEAGAGREEEQEEEEGDQEQSDDEDHQRPKEQHHNVTSHTFAIVIKIDKPLDLTPIIKVNYHTDAAVCWNGSERSRKQPFNDRFRVSENIDWDLDLTSPNAFIPINPTKNEPTTIDDQLLAFEEEEDDDLDDLLSDNLSNLNSKLDSDSIIFGPDSSKHEIKSYIPLEPSQYVIEQGGMSSLDEKTHVETNLFQNFNKPSTLIERGTYIFLLPIVFPVQTPETINIPNGSIIHKLDIQIQLPPKRDLRIPQSVALSTSPGHHFNNTWGEEDSVLMTNGPKSSSIFKRIGIRRNSNASISNKSLAASPPPAMSKLGSGSYQNFSQTGDTSRRSSITKIEDRVMNFKYILPVIRLPPSDATSTLNKSIYVNKVWNKSLGYEIVMPQKYTMLTAPEKVLKKQDIYEKKKGSISKNGNHMRKHTVGLQVKLVPLVKGIQLKRVKVNIVEKVTYTSLSDSSGSNSRPMGVADSNSTSFNANANNSNGSGLLHHTPSAPSSASKSHTNSRVKERIVPLYEIHTRPSSKKTNLQPLYTQSIKSCKNDNLLTFCYNTDGKKRGSTNILGGKLTKFLDPKEEMKSDEDVIISNPIKLDIPITFTANDEKKSIEKVWDWLNKAEEYNDYDELQFGMAIIDDLSRRNSITTMRSRVGSITSIGSLGSGGGVPIPPPFGMNPKPKSELQPNDLPVIGTPNMVIPSIVMTNENGISSSVSSSVQASHPDGSSFLSGIFGHHNPNHIPPNQPVALEDQDQRKELYSFFPDVSFNNLKVRHRLQLGFRISKPDETVTLADGTPKMHHYEVIVDTPIAFLSPLVDGEGDLPSYESVVGGFDSLSIVSTNNTSVVSGEAKLQPSSPLMSNTGTLWNSFNSNEPPGYSQMSVSSSSFELSPTCSPRKVTNGGNGASSFLSSAFRRGGENTTSLNSILVGDDSDNMELGLNNLVGRNVSKSSLEFERRMLREQQPPGYDDIILSDGLERVGLLSGESGSENGNTSDVDDDEEGDDNMSLCTGI